MANLKNTATPTPASTNGMLNAAKVCEQRDDLVKALQDVLAVFEYHKEPEKIAAVTAARAALAKAAGEQQS